MMRNRLPDELRPVEELPPLAEAKLAAPRRRRGMVRRPRIDRALEAGADMPVTLVVAPAGYVRPRRCGIGLRAVRLRLRG
jgi:hypothetical protein